MGQFPYVHIPIDIFTIFFSLFFHFISFICHCKSQKTAAVENSQKAYQEAFDIGTIHILRNHFQDGVLMMPKNVQKYLQRSQKVPKGPKTIKGFQNIPKKS